MPPTRYARLVQAATLLAVFAMAAHYALDSDTWWHLRAGEWILTHGAVPQVDVFSHTRLGDAWQYPGWLIQVWMAAVVSGLGLGGLNLWTAALVTLAFALLWPILEGGPLLRAFAVVLAALTSGIYWAARPYLATFVLAAAALVVLTRASNAVGRARWRWLLALPLLMVGWANSHGGFAVGLILVAIFGAAVGIEALLGRENLGRAVGPYLLIGLLMLAAVAVNPSGPVMWLYPFKTVGIQALQAGIQEWQSPNFHSVQAQPFIWLLLLTLGALGAGTTGLRWREFLLLVVFTYMSLTAARNIALFALVVPPILTRHAAPLLAAWRGRFDLDRYNRPAPPWFARLLAGVIGLLLVSLTLGRAALALDPRRTAAATAANFPTAAAAYLQQTQPPGNLFNPYNWGGYLIYALPEKPVFVDGRTDLYNDELLSEWLAVEATYPGWEAILARHQVGVVLTENGSRLDRELARTSGWRESYRDDQAVVYLVQPPP
jgi:hypothetical protein